MTSQQAKEILLASRPWTKEAEDAEVAEALQLCREDAELGRWFAEHTARQCVLRDRFNAVPVPEGLQQQILSEYQSQVRAAWWRRPVAVAAITSVVLVVALASIWTTLVTPEREDLSFNGYRNRMVKTVLRSYGMELETNDVAQVRAYLAQNHAPADYVLPEALAQSPTVGCGVLTWQNKRVAMVCFRTGKPLAPGVKSDLILFVIDQNDLEPKDRPGPTEFMDVSDLFTVSWRNGERIYLLAAFDAGELRKRL